MLLKAGVSWADSATLTRRERHAVFEVLADVAAEEKKAIDRATSGGSDLPMDGRKMPMVV